MKTTLIIDDTVLDRLRRTAAKRRTTISKLVEEALRLYLSRPACPREELPALPKYRCGGAAVDVDNRDALYRAMDGE